MACAPLPSPCRSTCSALLVVLLLRTSLPPTAMQSAGLPVVIAWSLCTHFIGARSSLSGGQTTLMMQVMRSCSPHGQLMSWLGLSDQFSCPEIVTFRITPSIRPQYTAVHQGTSVLRVSQLHDDYLQDSILNIRNVRAGRLWGAFSAAKMMLETSNLTAARR